MAGSEVVKQALRHPSNAASERSMARVHACGKETSNEAEHKISVVNLWNLRLEKTNLNVYHLTSGHALAAHT